VEPTQKTMSLTLTRGMEGGEGDGRGDLDGGVEQSLAKVNVQRVHVRFSLGRAKMTLMPVLERAQRMLGSTSESFTYCTLFTFRSCITDVVDGRLFTTMSPHLRKIKKLITNKKLYLIKI